VLRFINANVWHRSPPELWEAFLSTLVAPLTR
jgi:hypothetical protein